MVESDGFSVWADWSDLNEPLRLGSVILSRQRGKRTAGFAFDDQWLARGDFRSLDPDVQPFRGRQYPRENRGVFGFLTDSAPDRWGRRLMQRREVLRAANEERQPRRLDEYDYLLGVHDPARIGGLRFRKDDDGPFLAPDDPWATPPWTRLRELHAAASAMDSPTPGTNDSRWLAIIFAPGSSLGGARPKATVQDSAGGLWIAKFPAQNDTVDVGRWEYLVHRLAREAGINVPTARIESLSENGTTFLVQRFDRAPDTRRVHFASAMTLLARMDNDEQPASYLDLAEIISRTGDRTADDLVELWSRIAFFIAVSNCDDHLRNHGFLLGTQGWQLSPAYDINPDPTGYGLSLEIDATDNRLNFDLVLSVSRYFGLSGNAAERRLADILGVVSRWRGYAGQLGIPRGEVELMAPAFRVSR